MPTSDDITAAVQSALAAHVDEDTCEYIGGLLLEEDSEETREAVEALIQGSIDEDAKVDPVEVCRTLFELLEMGESDNNSDDAPQELRKLDTAIKMKDEDVQTFASGLGEASTAAQSEIATYYANMIDIRSEAAVSERARRKARQKELRQELENKERERAIQEAMDLLENATTTKSAEQLMDQHHAQDNNAQDVHFANFDLPNLRGGGPPLLNDASLTLSRGRRYGLMGRNGCGKTTFMTFVAHRTIPNAVPANMNMLLVRQEILGNEQSAVETVLQSDVKRTSVQKFIAWCEAELTRLENPDAAVEEEKTDDTPQTASTKKAESKGRQKLRDRKMASKKKAAKEKAEASTAVKKTKEESMEAKKTRLNEKLIIAYERLNQIEEEEGGNPEPRARKVLAGLGFSTEMQDKPTSELSGGWRMRVSLSCALFANPSLLLLDEPTNHLDLEAVLWLEKYLTTQFHGTLLVVSHDRHFLNEVVTDVVDFRNSKLTVYRGDISNYEAVRADDRLRQQRLREQQEAKKAHLQKYIDLHSQAGENGPKAARQKKSKMKKLEKIGVMAQDGKKYKASYDGDAEEVEEVEEEETVVLNFPDPGSFDGDIIRLEQVKFGYSPDKILLKDVDLTVSMQSRTALLGRNGCGKSTLIKLAVGGLRPMTGKAVVDPGAKIEYLAQHQLDQLDPDGTPLQTIVDRYPSDRSNSHIGELRRYLANFGLGGEVLPNQKIHTMSGGQKCRLCLACAMYRKPHLLVLDEPTNHLDLETTQALIDAIRDFQGGVILVSHDQYLLSSVCKELYVVENGSVERLDYSTGDEAFKAYKKDVIAGRR